MVGDVTGIHQVSVRFCECLDAAEQFTYQWVQLLRQGWFPATTHTPATAFTFRMLNAFQELNFQGKTNLYDYWRSLERITDNSGSGPSLVSLSPPWLSFRRPRASCLEVHDLTLV